MSKKSREEIKRNMQAIRSTNTKIEISMGKALWSKGHRYRKNVKSLPGKPDFVFRKYRVAIFCDSEFWHGKDWELLKQRLVTNPDFWIRKIETNIARDARINEELKNEGWTVLRFWEKQIKKTWNIASKLLKILSQLFP